jgi:hypothetical protein
MVQGRESSGRPIVKGSEGRAGLHGNAMKAEILIHAPTAIGEPVE